MKDYAWKIKIADLLNNPWDTDNINFENKFLKSKDIILGEKWIKWKVFLQWLNQDEILLKINEIEFDINYNCDKCLENFSTSYKLENLEDVRFVNPENIEINEEIHDTLFPIDMKNQTIDLSWLVEIVIKNEEPIIKDCWKHKNTNQKEFSENQENFNQATISFQELLKNKKNVKN